MTDRYFRLVTILVNICPCPLRELFLKHAMADPNSKAPYTTLDAYLFSRKKDIMKLKSKKVLRQHQYGLLFPPTPGQADLNTWDLTLLSLMLTDLFKQELHQSTDLTCINVIRGIRNDLQHISGTCQITISEFDNMYTQLSSTTIKLAFSAKGQVYSDEIETEIRKVNACVLTDLGDVLRQWYLADTTELKDNMQDLKEETVQLKDEIREIREDTTQTRHAFKKATVKCARPSGKMSKRFKTEDHILDKMRGIFMALMSQGKTTDFQSPPESARIIKELDENHLVVVSGYGKCLYQQTALSVIENCCYTEDRCVVVSFPSDWRHFGPEDVDLAVFLNPFGKEIFDEDKARSMKGILDSINDSTMLATSADDTIDVMIITDQSILDECKTHFMHDVIDNPVIVYKPTTEDSPVELVDSESPVCSVSTDPHYSNLLVQSIAYCKHHRMQFVDKSLLEEAHELFRSKKVIVISGPRGSGKTTLALSLLSSYEEGHYLILSEPSDLSHIRFGVTCVVVIEDIGGKYSFEMSFIQNWLRKFDLLYSTIKEGKLNVIITCDMERLHAFMIDTSKHPILNSVLTLKKNCSVKVKQEPSTEGYPGTSHPNSARNPPFASVKTIKNVNFPLPEDNRFHDFCQYIDGSYMILTVNGGVDQRKKCVSIQHFSSDFQYIRQYQTDISPGMYGSDFCICCTDTGALVLTCYNVVHLCRITDGIFQSLKSKDCACFGLCFSVNRIVCLSHTRDITMLNINLKTMKKVTLCTDHKRYECKVFVQISIQTFVYINDNDDIVFENQKKKQIKYLREKDFSPHCACAADPDSVFVLGSQAFRDIRILQVNSDAEIITDILLNTDELQLDGFFDEKYCIEFDSSNCRLVLLTYDRSFSSHPQTLEIREIFLQ